MSEHTIPKCPDCRRLMDYYRGWYCPNCDDKETGRCKDCNKTLWVYGWYCFGCLMHDKSNTEEKGKNHE